MTENAVKHLAFTGASPMTGFVKNWIDELHAMNDNEEPDPPPAIAARIPWVPPFTTVEPRALLVAA
jgi:hypothetical protein